MERVALLISLDNAQNLPLRGGKITQPPTNPCRKRRGGAGPPGWDRAVSHQPKEQHLAPAAPGRVIKGREGLGPHSLSLQLCLGSPAGLLSAHPALPLPEPVGEQLPCALRVGSTCDWGWSLGSPRDGPGRSSQQHRSPQAAPGTLLLCPRPRREVSGAPGHRRVEWN